MRWASIPAISISRDGWTAVNTAAIVLDVACAALPVATGRGLAVRALSKGGEAALAVERTAVHVPELVRAGQVAEKTLQAFTATGNGGDPIVPNPNRIDGKSDHQSGVQDAFNQAQNSYPQADGYEIRSNKSVKQQLGIDRRPDLSIWKNGDLQHIIEVAQTKSNGWMVPREAVKFYEYNKYGFDSTFYLLGK
jgi:hypothetical protein